MSKRLILTKENFLKTIERLKWQTRRLHDRPRYQVGDIVALCEPTQALDIWDIDLVNLYAKVLYPWTDDQQIVSISSGAYRRLVARKNWKREAIARFMLNDFARHWVEIAKVREEQLQGIFLGDAIAEGIEIDPDVLTQGTPYEQYNWVFAQAWRDYVNGGYDLTPIESLASLWDSIHSDKSKRWETNPTVIAYSYKLVKP